MKYSAAVLAFAAAVAAQPAFLNTQFNVVTGQPFTLNYSGCEAGCTILLKSGPSGNLNTVQTLTTSATGSSTTVTVANVPAGTYAFEIIDSTGANNYSEQFTAGSGTATTSASASSSSAPASTSSAPVSTTSAASSSSSSSSASSTSVASSTSASSSSSSSSASSSATTLSTVTSSAVTTPSASSTTTRAASTSASATAAPSTVPDNGAGSLGSSLSLVLGAAAALVLVY
ncbi:unnamed protein product [Clonostachys byssicola]|uniref:Yeast cell wall synthesis Kre9/Knh1-like N-terminal domain-containing protein n=1 Tax=Clonostachys byssicola TaxID=160290 RepID=A0A9N9TZU9_9HYPO|nr:unnamed protein product [Clonostachys byssicola]